MKFRVSISPQARRDIDRNTDWWAEHHSVEQALRWSDAVYDQIETLADFPERNGLAAENDDFPYEIRDRLLGLGSRPSVRSLFSYAEEMTKPRHRPFPGKLANLGNDRMPWQAS